MSKDELGAWAEALQEQVLEEARSRYSERAIRHWQAPHNFQAPPASCASGCLTGPCGDTIEIWLDLADSRIRRAGFLTDGCSSSIVCGSAAAWLAEGMSAVEAKGITQQRILDELGGLPEIERHCALLAFLVLSEALEHA
jgi:nitrogen fixation NifU-like protein